MPWLEVVILALSFVVLVVLAEANQRSNDEALARLDSFSTYDARGGGYRGWYDLLAREGIAVDRFELRPAFLDASVRTLIYAEPLEFDPRQSEATDVDAHALEAWVRAGGRLIYAGHDNTAARQHLLSLPYAITAPKSSALRVAPSLAAAGIATLAPQTNLRYRIPKGGRALAADAAGAYAVRYPFGRGSVTAIVDESLFTNGRLALADDARFAYALVAEAGGGRVVFDEAVHGYEAPLNWWDLVPRALVVSFLLGVLAVAIAIVGGAIRLGPPIVPVARADRGSGDFLDSLAALLLRGHAAREALQEAWLSTRRMAAAQTGLADDATAQDIALRVEGSETRSSLLALEALTHDVKLDDANLLRGMALAQRLRKEFNTHGRTGR